MNRIQIGWSEVSLVPAGKKVSLAGQFYERISDVVETPISVTALALSCGDASAIFCACDLVGTSHRLLEAVRERLSAVKGFPLDAVMISAIHTHTSIGSSQNSDAPTSSASSIDILKKYLPDVTYESLAPYAGDDLLAGKEAFDFLAERIAEAAKNAWESRKDGQYASGFGRAAVGMCRRVCYDDGSAKMWGDVNSANFTELEGGNDSGVELLFTFTPDRKLTGVIANVACPAQVLEHRSFISSDYFGKLKGLLREEFGEEIYLLGLVSPAGDQCPRDMIRWIEPETPINDPNIVREKLLPRKADPSMFDIRGCEKVAKRLNNEILSAYEELTDADFVSETVMAHEKIALDMPLRRVTPTEIEAAKKVIADFRKELGDQSINFRDNARMHVHAGTIARSELQEEIDTVEIEMHVLRLGNLAFATNPYELFLNYGNQIRARSRATQTFLIQLSCGVYGYLPTEKAEQGSHYSAYVSSGYAGHEGGDLLVRKTLSEIAKMFSEE